LSRALVPALIVTALCGFTFSVFSVAAIGFGSESRGPVLFIGSQEQALFNSLVAVERLRRAGALESDAERRTLEIYIAGVYAPLSARPPSFGGALVPFRQLANDIAARHPTVSEPDLATALKQLGRDRLDDLNRHSAADGLPTFVLLPPLMLVPVIARFGYLSLLLAFAFRGGLMLRLFRLALVDAAGDEATRWRALWRAALAWAPLIGLQLLADWAIMALAVPSTVTWTLVGALCAVMVIGACWAIADPARGLHDRVAGTWLVPR
jgi:hypothetical protein